MYSVGLRRVWSTSGVITKSSITFGSVLLLIVADRSVHGSFRIESRTWTQFPLRCVLSFAQDRNDHCPGIQHEVGGDGRGADVVIAMHRNAVCRYPRLQGCPAAIRGRIGARSDAQYLHEEIPSAWGHGWGTK